MYAPLPANSSAATLRIGEPGASMRWSGRPGSGRTSCPRVSTTPAPAFSTIRAVSAMSRVRSRSSAITVVTAATTLRSAWFGRDRSAESRLRKPTCRPSAVNRAAARPCRKPAGRRWSAHARTSDRGTAAVPGAPALSRSSSVSCAWWNVRLWRRRGGRRVGRGGDLGHLRSCERVVPKASAATHPAPGVLRASP